MTITTEPDILVSARNISKDFATGLQALDAVNLDIREGGFQALLGPSGCGKSTLLRILARLAEPTTGALVWCSEQPRIGVVFQDPTLMPWARIDDNVALPLRLAGQSRPEARARAVAELDRVGLASFADAYPRELSGGMKMRAALARALIAKPQLLLLDEPFAALDEITRMALNHDLLTLWQDSKLRQDSKLGQDSQLAVLFVTHSVFEAVFLAQQIHVMSPRPGRIVQRIPINFGYPRRDADRLTTGFAETAGLVSAALATAVEGASDVE